MSWRPVVKHLHHHSEVEGLSLAAVAGTKNENGKKCFYFIFILIKFYNYFKVDNIHYVEFTYVLFTRAVGQYSRSLQAA